MKKIVFMGTPDYAADVLGALFDSEFGVVGVFTQPDRAAGRGGALKQSAVKALTRAHNAQITAKIAAQNPHAEGSNSNLAQDFSKNAGEIPRQTASQIVEIFEPTTLKDPAVLDALRRLAPDFIVVAAYGLILPPAVLEVAPCINLHASLLPRFRGASPIQAAVLAGEAQGGVTAMRMGVGLDDGDILAFAVTDTRGARADELFARFGRLAARLALRVLRGFGDTLPVRQFGAASSKCGKIKKDDGLVSFARMGAGEIAARWRAFTPWPGVFLASGLKLVEVAEISAAGGINSNLDGGGADFGGAADFNAGGALNSNLGGKNGENFCAQNAPKCEKNATKCGEILAISPSGVVVQTARGALVLTTLQESGKKPLPARDYLNGKRLKVGDIIA